MRIKISEWNDIVNFSKSLAQSLSKRVGISASSTTYTTYDGKKGIRFNVFDSNNVLYDFCCSGIWDTKAEYIEALKNQYTRLTNKFAS